MSPFLERAAQPVAHVCNRSMDGRMPAVVILARGRVTSMASKYALKEYGPNPHAGTNNNAARTKGWGPGWPNCQSSKMARAKAPGGAAAQVRKEIVALVETLFEITELEGYKLKAASTGGYNCRAIAGTRTASNHSWGLAVDLNWNDNPYSLIFKSDIPPAVVHAWEQAGFYWGGRYRVRKDAMHFEYLGSPSNVARDLKIAKARLASLRGPVKPPTPKPPVVTPPAPKPAAGRKPGSRTIARGNTGADVRVLQRFLGIKDDGVFGAQTDRAVRSYQVMRKVKQTGIVDAKLWAPILKALGIK